jgi:hypothetical protein
MEKSFLELHSLVEIITSEITKGGGIYLVSFSCDGIKWA